MSVKEILRWFRFQVEAVLVFLPNWVERASYYRYWNELVHWIQKRNRYLIHWIERRLEDRFYDDSLLFQNFKSPKIDLKTHIILIIPIRYRFTGLETLKSASYLATKKLCSFANVGIMYVSSFGKQIINQTD